MAQSMFKACADAKSMGSNSLRLWLETAAAGQHADALVQGLLHCSRCVLAALLCVYVIGAERVSTA